MAGRVCLALGIDDPEQWLHEASPRKLAFWDAFFQVEPFGNEWYRDAVMCQMISGVVTAVAATAGGKVKHHSHEDFMPVNWAEKQKRKVTQRSNNGVAEFQAWAQKFGATK